MPQNDPHDALIILNIHNWGKNFSKKIAHQLRLPSAKVRPRGRVGVKILFCVFHPFLNSPPNSEYFEYRHIGSNKKFSPCRLPITKSPAPLAPTKPMVPHNQMPLECFLLNITLRDLPGKCEKKIAETAGKCGRHSPPPRPWVNTISRPFLRNCLVCGPPNHRILRLTSLNAGVSPRTPLQ